MKCKPLETQSPIKKVLMSSEYQGHEWEYALHRPLRLSDCSAPEMQVTPRVHVYTILYRFVGQAGGAYIYEYEGVR
ncbi:MAG: hypothetical protein ACYTE8_00990 [Planctomycetota bacterium]|jgi:hypothetical protein